ncbi:uncharacterized protein LOC119465253 [Dermacentor silvarum]|uniref:uncharacterized protein LOC119465253 n=1 Tax=Dermacentor silvarum TaxID=543639 RepID=UPI001899B21D|nr:uncharacterized protein LOC119465253 [Dermacentor silvarum]
MLYFIVTLLLGLYVQTSVLRRTDLEDLYNMLNTSNPIYIIQRTYGRNPTEKENVCDYYVKVRLNTTYYEFNLTRATGKRRRFEATITEKMKKPALIIRKPTKGLQQMVFNQETTMELTKLNKETTKVLIYWDDDEKCGVFKVKKDNKTHCELHAWNDTLHGYFAVFSNYYSGCIEKYEDACRHQKSHTVNLPLVPCLQEENNWGYG